ncbi:MAG TPA: tripartite tricarboxylate transporter substrate binding protein, partial [Beijerinckiaceae bacterium]|nr:tripartite tricarboxylate transporter substrate binding protein [Beijerinckiaceae bacterium]
MNRMSKGLVVGAAAGMLLAAVMTPGPAAAQTYPERGLTLIVPYGAGGGTDVTARLLARDLEAVLGKPV